MKKKFKLQDLDCANCAAKMEEAIKRIEGVADANVSFMTQKMTIEAEESRFDEIMKEVVAAGRLNRTASSRCKVCQAAPTLNKREQALPVQERKSL